MTEQQETGRTVDVVVTYDGERLGTTGPFPVVRPWWSDVTEVVAHLEALLGVPVVVLRLLRVHGGEGGRDGAVTYHAEALRRPREGALREDTAGPGTDGLLAPADLRADWATTTGLWDALTWAFGELGGGTAEQVRTWNLSGLFRMAPQDGRTVWLKTTSPRFNACEATVIRLFAAGDREFVPDVVAADTPRRRVLLGHVDGKDCYGADPDVASAAVRRLAAAQAAIASPTPPPGLRDRTPATLPGLIDRLLDGEAGRDLTAREAAGARRLTARLPASIAELDACGLPHTVVHGDFHPGNWRSDGRRIVMVDFADSHFGHPVLDGLRPRDFLDDRSWEHAADAWVQAWSHLVPGSDPRRALAVGAPLAHLLYAVRYQEFLDNIERSERVYHEGDPVGEIRAALAAWASSPPALP
ncbi:aminoglycoside phosphotransferase family protein [Streptomyces sp. NPDC088354]|uniref:aminoglycoside phosphotransferase family protein n=1 Tax=Streptomyces sp. NPDC088354 TaxID=3365856 RepID=UPI00380CA30D